MVIISTINGKITKDSDPYIYTWTSKEDQEYFYSLLEKNRVMIMGSTTYKAVKKNIRLNKNRLRIVLTKNPDMYQKDEVKGQLEFSKELPAELIQRLNREGYKQALLLGGGKINTSFLKMNLVDRLYLTLEPTIFGLGKPFLAEDQLEISLKLISKKKLNNKGTLLLKYQILKK